MTKPDAVQPERPTELPCPRCRAPLFEGKAGSVRVHGCGACGGMWLSNALSRALVFRMEAVLVELSDRASGAAWGKTHDLSGTAYCPYDGLPLSRVTARGVTLDVCATHGTWFDAEEVRQVAEAFEGHRRAAAAVRTPMDVSPPSPSSSPSYSPSRSSGDVAVSAGADLLIGLFAVATLAIGDSSSDD